MSAVASTGTPAGWYQDPIDSALLRWWDGIGWTNELTEKQIGVVAAAAPGPASVVTAPSREAAPSAPGVPAVAAVPAVASAPDPAPLAMPDIDVPSAADLPISQPTSRRARRALQVDADAGHEVEAGAADRAVASSPVASTASAAAPAPVPAAAPVPAPQPAPAAAPDQAVAMPFASAADIAPRAAWPAPDVEVPRVPQRAIAVIRAIGTATAVAAPIPTGTGAADPSPAPVSPSAATPAALGAGRAAAPSATDSDAPASPATPPSSATPSTEGTGAIASEPVVDAPFPSHTAADSTSSAVAVPAPAGPAVGTELAIAGAPESASTLPSDAPEAFWGSTPARGQGNTVPGWVLALAPLIAVGAAYAAVIGAESIGIALGPLPLLAGAGLGVIIALAAALTDPGSLRRRGYDEPVSGLWVLLSPLVYLVLRSARVHREGGRSWLMVPVHLVAVAGATVVALTMLLPAPGAAVDAAAAETQLEAALLADTGVAWTVDCTGGITAGVDGTTVSCAGSDAAGGVAAITGTVDPAGGPIQYTLTPR